MTQPLSIEIIPAARLPVLRDELVRQGRPAVVTGLFDGQPLAALTDLAKVRELVGPMRVEMSRNYIDSELDVIQSYLKGRKSKVSDERKPTTFGDYLDLAVSNREMRWIVGELPVPETILAAADLRLLGITEIKGGYSPRNVPRSPTTARAMFFVGNASNGSELHTDWDGYDVLLYQGFGRKRIIVFPAQAAPLFHPFDMYGTLRLSGVPDGPRQEFVRFAGGVEHILEPGQAMFMPAFVWHHVEYLDPALSVSIRLAGIQDKDALYVIENMHRDSYIQNLMAASRDPDKAESCRAAILDIRQAFDRPYPSARAKFRSLRALAKEHCHKLGLISLAYPFQTWLELEDMLDGIAVSRYHFLRSGSRLQRWRWHTRERVRSLLRRAANRIAYWA